MDFYVFNGEVYIIYRLRHDFKYQLSYASIAAFAMFYLLAASILIVSIA